MPFDPQILPYLNPAIDRRTALVTAGTSGVGFYTVLHLHLHGYVVYLTGRSRTRASKAIERLQAELAAVVDTYTPEQRAKRFLGELHYLDMDLARLSSVLDTVAIFQNLERNLNILVNNAGVFVLTYTITEDGFELQLQTGYIAPFLLTIKLLPMLDRTTYISPEAGPPRVVYVSSVIHHIIPMLFNLSTRLNYAPNFLFSWYGFAVTKAAGIHLVKMLALHHPRMLCVSVLPGNVMNTDHFAYLTRLPIIGILFWCLFQLCSFFFGITSQDGAVSVAKCCMDPTLSTTTANGAHFLAQEPRNPSYVARNMNYAAQTWMWTIHQLGKRNIDMS
ncbi:NAD(P)-binding protein [Metschnikowia bicuspidata]|uniref:NAD(P)-binding protein n=1 Tax=Metschnikowia bicuspidata TaxID=27322 RepID=A0A4P9ZF87_9ASCO|nr:NAD(P)-binding protein [Metschnikowia bicuspidata]